MQPQVAGGGDRLASRREAERARAATGNRPSVRPVSDPTSRLSERSSVVVLIRKVRRKLELAAPDWVYIHTHFGIGYRFTPEPLTRH